MKQPPLCFNEFYTQFSKACFSHVRIVKALLGSSVEEMHLLLIKKQSHRDTVLECLVNVTCHIFCQEKELCLFISCWRHFWSY